MTRAELAGACLRWLGSGGDAEFAAIIAAAAAIDPAITAALAAVFQIAPSTVERWASGVARPHPILQRLAVKGVIAEIHA